MKLAHWPLVGCLLQSVQRRGTGWGRAASPGPGFRAVRNVTAHPINSQCTSNSIAV